MLLLSKAALHDVGNEIEMQVAAVNDHTNETSDEDTSEDDADHADAEAIECAVGERENFKEGIVDSVHESCVEIDKGDGGVLDGDLDGFDLRLLVEELALGRWERTNAPMITADGLSRRWSISDWDCSLGFPVSFRSRAARRRRMLGVDVSGRKKNITISVGPAIQRISHKDHLHPLAMTAKPDSSGPKAGPQ